GPAHRGRRGLRRCCLLTLFGAPTESVRAPAAEDPRHRQPEGRCRQDHDGSQPRCLPGHHRLPSPRVRPRPTGQRVDRARVEPAQHGDVDVRRHPERSPDRGLHRAVVGSGPLRGTRQPRPGRRRDRARACLQPRAQAEACDRRGHRRLRLRPHRLPAVARPADRQRPRCGGRGRGAGPVRVLRPGRARPAAAQRRPGAAEPEPVAGRLGHHLRDVRRPHEAVGPGRGGCACPLRRQGVPQRRPQDGAPLGGTVIRAADHRVRPDLAGCDRLPRAGQGDQWWRVAADSV
ncbi:MAG: Chromosome (plasmid) partitioning protein ParA, partial [uncultured Acidimicrobiales bacterium]